MKILDQAVGANGAGVPQDIRRVEELLAIAGFGDGGGHGKPTGGKPPDLGATIRKFQGEVVKAKKPDGRIDPDGETLWTLVAEARKQVFLQHRVSRNYGDARVTQAMGQTPPKVQCGDIQKPHLISPLTFGALQMLGYCCGLEHMKITEGIRTYEMMASYFLRKITDGSTGVRGDSYRHALEILAKHNKGKAYEKGKVPDEHTKAVADRMRKRCEQAKVRVSMHVVSENEYRALNVVDLGWGSNPQLQDKTRARVFARLLDSFHMKNKSAKFRFVRTYYPPHHLNKVLDSPYGKELKVENAWHIEFEVAGIPPILG